MSWWSSVTNWVSSAVNKVSGAVSSVVKTVSDAVSGSSEGITTAIQTVADIVNDYVGGGSSKVKDVEEDVEEIVKTEEEKLAEKLYEERFDTLEKWWDWFTSTDDKSVEKIKGSLSDVTEWVTEKVDDVGEVIDDVAGVAFSWIDPLMAKIEEALIYAGGFLADRLEDLLVIPASWLFALLRDFFFEEEE